LRLLNRAKVDINEDKGRICLAQFHKKQLNYIQNKDLLEAKEISRYNITHYQIYRINLDDFSIGVIISEAKNWVNR